MQADKKPSYVLFMTPTCKFCNSFLQRLKSNQLLLESFNIVDIDTIPSLPDEVDEVPCVYDGKNVYKGKEAFTWINEVSIQFLEPAGDGLNYSFVNGDNEKVFNNYSLINQMNGASGVGDSPIKDPSRMTQANEMGRKQGMSMEDIMAERANDLQRN